MTDYAILIINDITNFCFRLLTIMTDYAILNYVLKTTIMKAVRI